MRHRSPGMVCWRRLGKPDIASVAGELPAFERPDYGIPVTNLAASRVHEIRATLHCADQGIMKHVFGLGVKWGVDGDDIADAHHRLDAGVIGQLQLLLDAFGKLVAIRAVGIKKRNRLFVGGEEIEL